MFDAQLAERISLLRAKGGWQAAAYWLLRTLTGIDVYCFYAVEPAATPSPPELTADVRLVTFASPQDVEVCDAELLAEIDARSGRGATGTVHQGGRIYALVRGRERLSQLTIDFGEIHVDTPMQLILRFDKRAAFLSYLYTAPATRRSGWAATLIALVTRQLEVEGWTLCICHIQATNLKSVNTFRRLGWRRVAWLFTTTRGRLLGIVRSDRDRRIALNATHEASATGRPEDGGPQGR